MIRKCKGEGLLTHEQRLGLRTVSHHHLVRQHVLVLLLHDVPYAQGGVEAHIVQALIDLCACHPNMQARDISQAVAVSSIHGTALFNSGCTSHTAGVERGAALMSGSRATA